MTKTLTSAQAMYLPQTYKSFEGALAAFLAEQCPQIGGSMTRQVLVQGISQMVAKFYPETSHLRQGQIVWPTVHRQEKSSYGKAIRDCQLTPVVLDLIRAEDAAERAQGKRLRDMKKEAVARLCRQAYEQDGCLCVAELAVMLKISAPTVCRYIREWETDHQTVLPRRGSIHDMGPTLTHKKIILHKLFIEQKSVQQTSRETYHSPPAIQRYISTFRQVLLCRQKGMSTEQIAFATRHSQRLIREYEEIIAEYQKNHHTMNHLLRDEVRIENNLESWIIEYSQEMEQSAN
jgi:molybdenum-dependent DNA-binding transcriptional regulator ModE